MAYRLYGATPADYFMDPVTGVPIGGQTATVWTARTGGTQVTDLLSADGVPQTLVAADSTGTFRFQAQDTNPLDLWVNAGGTTRYLVRAVDLGAIVDDLLTSGTVTEAELDTFLDDFGDAEETARNAAIATHNADVAAHPAKVSAMNGTIRIWKSGNVPGVGSVAMPTVADGLQLNDLIVHYG